MPPVSMLVKRVAIVLLLAGFPLVAHAQNAAPGARPRWGAEFGFRQFGGNTTFDYKNSLTPFSGASGPYTGAVIVTKNVGPGIVMAGGYRAPIHAGSRVGFGFDAEFGGGGGHPADKSVTATGTSPAGVQVTFSTERGGIVDFQIFGGGGHVSYSPARRLSVMAGVKVTSLRVKPGFGSYRGPVFTPGLTNYLAQAGDKSPKFWRQATAPWVGAELFLASHASVDVAASFESTKSLHLADTPWSLDFARHGVWLSVAIRIFH